MSSHSVAEVELARSIARQQYGDIVEIETLPVGNHIVLRLRRPTSTLLMKFGSMDIQRRSIHKEAALLGALASRGIPVPKLAQVETDAGRHGMAFFVTESSGEATLVDWARESGQLPGLLFSEMGSILARLHDLDLSAEAVALGLDEAGSPADVLAEIFEFATWMVGQDLLSAEDLGLHRGLEVPSTAGRGLCHADYHAPQCIVEGGRISAVVDWESAWIGNPNIDLAFTHAYLDYYCMTQGTNALVRAGGLRARFFEGYGSVRPVDASYELDYLPVRMAHLVGVMRTWHDWGGEVWSEALLDRLPRATALYRAYARKVRELQDAGGLSAKKQP
jgi:aminoglycoside phosphotransferase (APT) family kinase protein